MLNRIISISSVYSSVILLILRNLVKSNRTSYFKVSHFNIYRRIKKSRKNI